MNLNVSSLKTYMHCQKKAYYLHDLKRAKPGPPGQALLTGTIWHELMEARLTNNVSRTPEGIIYDALSQWMPDHPKLVAACQKDLDGLMVGYNHWQKPEDWEVSSVETLITAPLPPWKKEAAPHRVKGIVDALVKWNGKWWHLQHKTCEKRKNLPMYWMRIARDWHECIYEYMLRQSGYEPYGGTLLLTARKFTKDEAEANPGTVLTHQFISRPQSVVDKAVNDALTTMDEWAKKLDSCRYVGGPHYYVEDLDSCFGVYGNSICQYYSVCHSGMDIHGPEFITIQDRYDELEAK